MARPKKFTDAQSKDRRKVQTREAVRRTRKKKAGMTVLSETGVTIVTEDFLSGEKTTASLDTVVTDKVLENWEKPALKDYVSTRVFDGVRPIEPSRLAQLKKNAQRALAKGQTDNIESVLSDPRGTLKIDDSILDQPVAPEQIAAHEARLRTVVGVSANADKSKSKRTRTPRVKASKGFEAWEADPAQDVPEREVRDIVNEAVQGSVGKEAWE